MVWSLDKKTSYYAFKKIPRGNPCLHVNDADLETIAQINHSIAMHVNMHGS